MGYIKEPKGIDFIIQSKPLTEEERKVISELFRKDIAKQKAKQARKKSRVKKKKTIAKHD